MLETVVFVVSFGTPRAPLSNLIALLYMGPTYILLFNTLMVWDIHDGLCTECIRLSKTRHMSVHWEGDTQFDAI